ncbi:MAG: hypothetical protein ACTHLK_22465 [Brucella intermedia]
MLSKEHAALVEKVAKAIYASRDGSNITPWLDLNCEYQARLLSDAQAAISTILAAIAEADTAMLQAAQDAWLADPCRKSSTLWRAMLAASALGEQSE